MVRTKKRTLTAIAAAALLCMLAALVCFFMPAWKTAYAAETTVSSEEDLNNAISAASEGDIIKLGGDITVSTTVTIPSEKHITIDLNDFTISRESDYVITNKGTLTLKNGTIKGGTRGISSTSSTAKTYLVDCTVSGTTQGVYLSGKGYLEAENSTISGGTYGLYVYGSTAVIAGGTISGKTYDLYGNGSSGNSVTVDGTELKAAEGASSSHKAISFNGGNLTLKNVTANGNITLYASADVTIESGTYTLEMIEAKGAAALSIVGGTFVSDNITAFFDSGWLVNGETYYALRSTGTNGTYIVSEYNNDDTDAVCIGGYVASVDGTKYTTVDEALSAATGKTLTLLTNIKKPITVSSTMTLDLGIYSITAADGAAITVGEGVTLTIKGSGTVSGSEYGQAIANNGTVVLQGGTYEQAIDLDWIDEKYALSVENVSKEPEYTVTDEVMASITRNGKTCNFASLYTVFTKDIIQSDETIVLQADFAGSVILGIDKHGNTYTLDLNGHVLNGAIILYGGTLNIVNTATKKAAIEQKGNTIQILPESGNTAKVTLGENIAVRSETGAAVFIQTKAAAPSGSTFTPVALLESKADLYSRDSFALAGNGSNHCTEIAISGGSVITDGNAPAIYHPQYGTLTIENAEVRGATGIEMRAGQLTISGDSTIEATASAFEETPNGNGSTMTGVAVAVSQHTTNLPVSVTIEGGTLKGVKAVYEKDLQGGAADNITLSLKGGTFEGEVESQNVTGFISGGSFTDTVADELLAGDALMVFENGQYSVLESGSAAAENIVITVGKVGYTSEDDAQKAGVVVKIEQDGAPAEGYLSLADAVAAVPKDNVQKTIVFLGGKGTTVSAPGVRVFDGQNIVIDFNQVTFDVTDTVGSPNTETNGFQLNKGAVVVMKNGTLTSKTAKILIQQYCELTVEDMKLDMSACPQVQYVISNNHGTTRITGDTTIVAASGKVAFDVYYWPSNGYTDGITVEFDEDFTGKVEGKIEYSRDTSATNGWFDKANLVIKGNGEFDCSIVVSDVAGYDAAEASVSISGGSFTNVPTAEYLADASALYTDGTNYAVAAEDTAPSGMEKVIFTDSKGIGYASLAAAAGVETLYLYLDLDELTVNPGEEAVIDLNGKTLGNVVNNGMLTVKGTGFVTNASNNATLTINGGYYGSLTGDGTFNYLGGYFKTEVSASEGYACVDLSVEGASFDEDYNSEYPYAVYRTGEVTIEDSEWTLNESGSIDFSVLAYEGAAFTYGYAEAEDGSFTGGLPTAAGVWYIKATLTTSRVFADENGNKVCYPAEAVFEVTVKARPSVPTLVIEGGYCVGTALSEIALPAAENGTWAWKDAALTVGDTAGTANVIAVFTPTDTAYGKVEMEVSVTVVAHTEVTVPGYAATCNATGLTDGAKCSVCGKTLKEQTVISVLGHDLIYHLAKDPTCTKPGWAAYESCTRCDYSTYVEIPAAHTPGEAVRENEKAPTCTATGSYDEVVCCSVCGEELSRKTVTVEAAGHQWGAWETTKAPTCTAEGEETRTCTVCGETETRTAEKAAHTPVTVEGKDATCTEEGLSDGEKCSVCGETLKEQETIPALGHDFGDWTEDKDAGVETRTCSRCGATETRVLPEETFPVWGIVLICVGGVIVVGGAAAAILIVKKKRA